MLFLTLNPWQAANIIILHIMTFFICINFWKTLTTRTRSSCQQLQRVSQSTGEAPPGVMRPVFKEQQKKLQARHPRKRSKGWLLQAGRLWKLPHAERCFYVATDTPLDIQQLRTGSKRNLQLGSRISRELLPASGTSLLFQLAHQKSITQMHGPSTGVVNIQHYWDGHLQLGKGFQWPCVPKDPGTMSSSGPQDTTVPWLSPPDHQPIQLRVPFLTLPEWENWESNVLQRQAHLMCDLPAVYQRCQQAHNPTQYEPWDTAQSPEVMETTWLGKSISVLTRDLLFCPDQAQRLLEFHCNNQFLHHHWGLPHNIKQSTQLLLSPVNQQARPVTSKALDEVNNPHRVAAEVHDISDLFLPMWAPVSLTYQVLLLKIMPLQTSRGAVIEYTGLAPGLVEGVIQKLQTTLHSKYLAFLSGLPVCSSVFSKAMDLAITPQSQVKEIMHQMRQITTASLIPMVSWEDLHLSPWSGFQEDNETCTETAQEVHTEAQQEQTLEMLLLQSQTGAHTANSLEVLPMTKQHFHLRKNIRDKCLGIPPRVRESSDQTVAVPENIPTQEVLGNLNNQGATPLWELAIPPDSPHASRLQLVGLRGQLGTQLAAVQQLHKQAASRAAPLASAHRISQISQLSGDMTQAQGLSLHSEERGSSPGQKEACCLESQGPGKSTDSAQLLPVADKKDNPWEPTPLKDHGEGNAGSELLSTREDRNPAEHRKQPGISLYRILQGPWQRSHTMDLVVSYQHRSKHWPQVTLPDLPPGAPGGEETDKTGLQDSQSQKNLIAEPARLPGTAQPWLFQASEGQPLQDPLIEGKPLQDQNLKNDIPQFQNRTAHSPKRGSLPKGGFMGKMKSFCCCINPKTVDDDSMFSPAENMNKPRNKHLKKSQAEDKVPLAKVKSEKTQKHPKNQSPLIQKQRSLDLLHGSQVPTIRSQIMLIQPTPARVSLLPLLWQSPLEACATQPGNLLQVPTLPSKESHFYSGRK